MIKYFSIPLQPAINQSFYITFARDMIYWIRIYWVEAPEAGWTMDIGDVSGAPLVCGIPMLPGQNLLDQYPELHIPVILFIDTPGDRKSVPSFSDLGVMTSLYYGLVTS